MFLRAGVLVEVYEQGDDGWWGGVRLSDGQRGLFPQSFCEVLAGKP